MPGEKGEKLDTVRAGNVSATIWKNVNNKKDGSGTFEVLRVNFTKSFFKQSTNKREYSNLYLDLAEIPKAILVLQKAYELVSLKDENSKEDSEFEAKVEAVMKQYGCDRVMAERLVRDGKV